MAIPIKVNTDKIRKFKNLSVGEAFVFENALHIKTEEFSCNDFCENSVCLGTVGESCYRLNFHWIDYDEEVELLSDVEIVVKR